MPCLNKKVNPVLISQMRANIAAEMMLRLISKYIHIYMKRSSCYKESLVFCWPAARIETWMWQTLCSFLCQFERCCCEFMNCFVTLCCGVIEECTVLHPDCGTIILVYTELCVARLPMQTNLMSLCMPGLQGEIKRKKTKQAGNQQTVGMNFLKSNNPYIWRIIAN